jgi:hypothetical protein
MTLFMQSVLEEWLKVDRKAAQPSAQRLRAPPSYAAGSSSSTDPRASATAGAISAASVKSASMNDDYSLDCSDMPALMSDSDGSLYSSSSESDGARSRRAVRLTAAAAVRFAQRRMEVRADILRCLETPSPPTLDAAVKSTVCKSSNTSGSDSDAPESKAAVRLAIAATQGHQLPIPKKKKIVIDDHTPTPSPPKKVAEYKCC